jgi:hypothetical protein
MRKKTLMLIVMAAMIMMLAPGRHSYANPTQVTHYTVWYSCIISPPCCSTPVGEWTENCDGSWTGWGWMPGDNCTRTDVTYGESCSGGGGGPGGGGDNNDGP